jgi:uncharacterized protein with HEPN domain
MRPDAAALLWDARHAGQLVQQFIAGKTVTDYVDDVLVTSAVERQMAIIGEALNRLSAADPDTAAEITDLPRIVGFRNILVHGYTSVDSFLVWQLAVSNLPTLLAELDRLLAAAPD